MRRDAISLTVNLAVPLIQLFEHARVDSLLGDTKRCNRKSKVENQTTGCEHPAPISITMNTGATHHHYRADYENSPAAHNAKIFQTSFYVFSIKRE
jgi:hypothetical protein